MKKQIFLIILGLSLFFSTLINAAIVHYYPWKGDEYAREYCRDYNYADYLCYDPQKPDRCEQTGRTDCANFVSQALIYGGIDFSSCDINANYNICDDINCQCARPKDLIIGAIDIGIWEEILGLINAIDLPKVLHRSYCFYEYKHRQEEPGDVAILIPNPITGCADHVGIVADPSNRYYSAHTTDRCPGDRQYSLDIRFRKFFVSNCKSCNQKDDCTTEEVNKCDDCHTCDAITQECEPICAIRSGACTPRDKLRSKLRKQPGSR